MKAASKGNQSTSCVIQFSLTQVEGQRGDISIWEELAKSSMFKAMAQVYGQVSLRRAYVSAQVIGIERDNDWNGQMFSTNLVYCWDRDGSVPANLTVQQLESYSNAKIVSGVQYGRKSAFSTYIDASTMQEKSLYIPTEQLFWTYNGWIGDPETTDAKAVVRSMTGAWNPLLLWGCPEAQLRLRFEVKLYCTFRTVRMVPSEYFNGGGGQVEKPPYQVRLAFLDKFGRFYTITPRLYEQLLEATVGPNSDLSVEFVRVYDEITKQRVMNQIRQDEMKSVAVIMKREGDRYLLYGSLPDDLSWAGIAASTRADYNDQLYVEAGQGEPFKFEQAPVQFRLGLLTREEDDQINLGVNKLVVDGKLYDPVYGGINAVGYMDLQGPPEDDDRINNTQDHIQCNAWVECGNKTDEELLAINLTNTGPEYTQVSELGDGNELVVSVVPGVIDYGSWQMSQDVTVARHGDLGSSQVIIDIPEQTDNIVNALGVEVVLKVDLLDRSTNLERAKTITFGQQRIGVTFDLTLQAVVTGGNPAADPTVAVQVAYVNCVVETATNIPVPLSGAQLMDMFRMVLPSTAFNFEYRKHITGQQDYVTKLWGVPLLPTTSFLSAPVEASKIWARIKGAFSKAFKWLNKHRGTIVPIASAVLPPPYGTVVSTVSSAVDGIVANLNMGATTSQTPNAALTALSTVDESDAFNVVVQYRFAVPGSEPADITKHGTDWVDGASYTVPLTSVDVLQRTSYNNIATDSPSLWQLIQQYRNVYTGDEEPELNYQVRLKVQFAKRMTQEQADAFRATFRLGYGTGTFTDLKEAVPIESE